MLKFFADELKSGESIKDAWLATGQKYHLEDAGKITIARVFGLDACKDQGIIPDVNNGIQPIRILSRDPVGTDTYKVLGESRVANP